MRSYSSKETNCMCCFEYYFKYVQYINAHVLLQSGGDGWSCWSIVRMDSFFTGQREWMDGRTAKERAEDGWLTSSVFVDLRTDRTNITWVASKRLSPFAFEHASKWWLPQAKVCSHMHFYTLLPFTCSKITFCNSFGFSLLVCTKKWSKQNHGILLLWRKRYALTL